MRLDPTPAGDIWHGVATLNARKWVHLSQGRERDQGSDEPICVLPPGPACGAPRATRPPADAAPAARRRPTPRPDPPGSPHPTRRWRPRGSFRATHPAAARQLQQPVQPLEPVRRQQQPEQRMRLRDNPHLTRQHRAKLLQSVAFTPGTGKTHLAIGLGIRACPGRSPGTVRHRQRMGRPAGHRPPRRHAPARAGSAGPLPVAGRRRGGLHPLRTRSGEPVLPTRLQPATNAPR